MLNLHNSRFKKVNLYISLVLLALVNKVLSQCSPNPCINGNCAVTSAGGFTCSCPSGYSGLLCDQFYLDPCSTKPCANSGVCSTNDGRTFKCTCPPGYTGVRCETRLSVSATSDVCSSSPCLGGGTCISIGVPNVSPPYACVCPPQLTGVRCEITVGSSGSGSSGSGSSAVTLSPSLAPNPCISSPCKSGGTCLYNIQSVINPVFMCLCPPQYTGVTCETQISSSATTASNQVSATNACSSSPCLMGGTCIPIPQANVVPPYACVCPTGYTGTRCELLSALNPTSTAASTTAPNACASNPCYTGSTCISIGQPNVVPPYACVCPPNYTGVTCSTLVASAPTDGCAAAPCINGGTCRALTGSNLNPPYVCICPVQYSGTRCEQYVVPQNPCTSNPCYYGSTCTPNAYSTAFTCTCAPNYTGTLCNQYVSTTTTSFTPITYPNPCTSTSCYYGGTCVPNTLTGTYRCNCLPNYTGPRCTDIIYSQPTTTYTYVTTSSGACASSPCLNGATCIPYSYGYQCQCLMGFVGSRCETRQFIDLCNTNTCYNGGTCQTQNRVPDEYTVVCFCASGYTGSRCQTSISSQTTQAQPQYCQCMNGGYCRSDGSCQCQTGYYGTRCEYYQNPYTTTQAATTQNPCPTGLCVNGYCQIVPSGGASYCICNVGWTGPRCNVQNYCQSPSAVCYNAGTCANTQTGYVCLCAAGYAGSNCQTSTSGVTTQSNTGTVQCASACLNGGSCVSRNGAAVCQCQRGYIGLRCEVDICTQKPIVGVCLGSYTRYYYNPILKQCQPFYYSGCRGNENNFESLDSCNRQCNGH